MLLPTNHTVLAAPILGDKTVDEGGTLFVSCDSGNILSITTFQILDPSGTPVPVDFVGLYEVENVTRALAGVYTCVVTSTLTNATINDTGTVTVRCKLMSHNVMIKPINRSLINSRCMCES